MSLRGSGRVLARNTIYSIATQTVVSILAFFSIPALVRGVGEEGFGVLTLVWMTVGYFSILDFGVGQASVKFLAEHLARGEVEEANTTAWASVLTSLAVGIVTSLAIVLLIPWAVTIIVSIPPSLTDVTRQSFYWVTLAIPFVMLQGAFRAIPMAVQRFDMFNLMLGLSGLLQWGGALALVLLGYGIREIVWITVAIRIFGAVIAYVIAAHLFPQLSFRRSQRPAAAMKKLLSFGGWLTISQAAGPVMRYVDRFLVATFCTMKMFTYYVVPYEAVSRFLVLPLGLTTTLYPAIAERRSVRGNLDTAQLYTRAATFTIVTVLPASLVVAVFSTSILQWWLGGDFPHISGSVFSILAIAMFIQSVGYVPVTTLQAIGKPDVAPKFYVVELPVYVALCLILIPLWGIEGAAWAWLVRISISTSWLLWKTHRSLGWHAPFSLWFPAAIGLLVNGVLLLCLVANTHVECAVVYHAILVCVTLLAYAAAIWKFCLGSGERDALLQLLPLHRGAKA